jgi:mRNA-degrading endonuclease RelE of RelBE toxin-antitoxin system
VYDIKVTPEGARHLHSLPEKIRDAALALMLGPLAENPRRVGKPLLGDLAGMFSARRGDYRVVYEVDDERHVVVVHRVQHRRDVYRLIHLRRRRQTERAIIDGYRRNPPTSAENRAASASLRDAIAEEPW